MKRVLRAVLVMVTVATPSVAQQDRGTFAGAVRHPSGVIPTGVQVTVRNIATNATYDSVTNEARESSPSLEAFEEFKIQTSGMSAEYGRTGGGVFNFVMKSGTNRIHGSAHYLVNYPTLGFPTNDFGGGQNFQVIDTLSWIRGRHSIRAGVDCRRSYLRWRTNNGPAEIDFSQAQTGMA